MKNKVIQGGTLLLFVVLVTSFVLYSSGYFEDKAKEIPTNNKSSTPVEKEGQYTEEELHLMHSSKSFVIKDPHELWKESFEKSKDTLSFDNIMGSSKSKILFDIEDLPIFIDSIIKKQNN